MAQKKKIDHATRRVTLANGATFTLQPLNAIIFGMVTASTAGKPEPPEIPLVKVLRVGQEVEERNPDDPEYLQAMEEYQAALERWSNDKNLRVSKYVIDNGIAESVPPEFIAQNKPYFHKDFPPSDWKYTWVIGQFNGNEHLITDLMQLITGQTVATGEGVAAATETFQPEGERTESV